MKFSLPIALALCASADAQIVINQFYNFDNTTITTDAAGRWNVPIQGPSSPGSVQGQHFVTFVSYHLSMSSSASFTVLNDTGETITVDYVPQGDVGPVGGVPSQVVGTIGEGVVVSGVANGTRATISYTQATPLVGSILIPPFDFSNPVSYNVFTVDPVSAVPPIKLVRPSGFTSPIGKTNYRVDNYTESCLINGTIEVRYVLMPGQFQIECSSGNAALGFFAPQPPLPQTAEHSVLGLQGISPMAPAVFLYSSTPSAMNPIGLCLASPLRMNGNGVVSNSAGTLIRPLEGSGTFLSGQTYYFQAWYRASSGGQAVALFSDSISVMLQ